jgi:hypothetical protein
MQLIPLPKVSTGEGSNEQRGVGGLGWLLYIEAMPTTIILGSSVWLSSVAPMLGTEEDPGGGLLPRCPDPWLR